VLSSRLQNNLKVAQDKGEKFECIPETEENYISFSREVVVHSFMKDGKEVLVKRDLRFIDSFRIYGFQLRCIIKASWQ